jgi:4-hydroxy-tetrahydrodipicolinate synthase
MEAETTLRIARECPNVVAIKEASGSMEQIQKVIDGSPEGFLVISGDDSLALPVMKAGGVGVISVAANSFPRSFATLIGTQARGGSQENDQMFEAIRPAVKMLFAEGNPPGVKAALAIKGVIGNYLRLPLVPISEQLYAALEAEIAKGHLE